MYQKIVIVGNLGQDPEMRYTQYGDPVTNLSVATNRTYKSGDETKKETLWFRVSVWGNQAEPCQQYLRKGSKVLVEGMLQGDDSGNPRTYKRNDGSYGASFDVRASTVQFLDSKEQ